MFYLYIFNLFFITTLLADDALKCDAWQISEAKKIHTPEEVLTSVKEIFQHFYQSPKAFYLPPYEVLKHGELKGFGAHYNEISQGKNSYVVNLKQAQASQYYVNCSKRNKEEICQHPPSYIWGGMGWYEKSADQKKLILNLHGNNEYTQKLSQHPGLDCSGFTYAVFSNAKLRVSKDLTKNPSFETADTTPARSYLNRDDKSCFREVLPDQNPKSALQAGDVIVWKQHMIIVENVGNNPFGVEHISTIDKCDIKNIKPETATLISVNSKGGFERHDINTAKDYLANNYFKKSHALVLKKYNKLISGIGMGISKIKFTEAFYFNPKVAFPLSVAWCKAKFSPQVSLPEVKVIRHLAFDENADKPCACFSREQDLLGLKP